MASLNNHGPSSSDVNSGYSKSSKQPGNTMLQKPELLKKETPNPENSIGLKKYTDGLMQYAFIDDPKRTIGNDLLEEIVNMSKKNHPELNNWKIHSNHVFNEYNRIQKILYYGRNSVLKLIQWSNDNNPKTWKWLSPLALDDGIRNTGNIKIFDGHNMGWISDGYKGQAAITIMSPTQFLNLASPSTLKNNKRNDMRGDEYSEKTIDMLAKRMSEGKPIDTPYLTVNKDNVVFSHEGQHRALAAIKAGISEIPVYVYSHHTLTDNDLMNISSNPTSVIKPDDRN